MDSYLQKDFKKQDIKRLRNLVSGNADEKSTEGIGYETEEIQRNEGDVWIEDDITWTIKNGIKVNIPKLQEAKKAVTFPLFCPSCKKLMAEHRDKKLYNTYNKCLNCVIDDEQALKNKGLWEDYKKFIINSDLDGIIELYKNTMLENINESTDSFINDMGHKEKWENGLNKDRALKVLEEGIQYLESLKQY